MILIPPWPRISASGSSLTTMSSLSSLSAYSNSFLQFFDFFVVFSRINKLGCRSTEPCLCVWGGKTNNNEIGIVHSFSHIVNQIAFYTTFQGSTDRWWLKVWDLVERGPLPSSSFQTSCPFSIKYLYIRSTNGFL